MSELRWLSIIFSLIIIGFVLTRSRQRNLDRVLYTLIAAVLFSLGLAPDWLNGLLEFFSFTPGDNGRIIGLLLLSTFLLYILLFRQQGEIVRLEDTLNRMVNALAKQQYRKEMNTDNYKDVFVVIPAYNEEENIGVVLNKIPSNVGDLSVGAIVVVDGGTDNTEDVVRKHGVNVATHVINRGGGAALHSGYDLALESGARYVVTLDADGQHQPEELLTVLQPLIDGKADLVNGSRVLGVYEKDQMVRAAGVVFFNLLISFLTMQRITDCSNAYRGITAEKLAEVRPRLKQRQFHSTELLLEVIKSGGRVVEVPITIKRRLSGESKKGPTFKYAFGFTRAIITTWLR